MEYGDLVHLLTTRFVNPGLLLTVSFAGEPCAVDGARIARTDGAALTPEIMARFLERLHRFVRLQRRLGWTAYELDAALVALRVGDFDEPDFLPELAALASLSSELGMPVGELRSWWRDLDTYRYTDDLPSAYEAVYLDERVRRRVRAHRGPHRPRGHQVDRARDQPVAGGVGRSRRAGQMLSASTELFTTTSYRVTRH